MSDLLTYIRKLPELLEGRTRSLLIRRYMGEKTIDIIIDKLKMLTYSYKLDLCYFF